MLGILAPNWREITGVDCTTDIKVALFLVADMLLQLGTLFQCWGLVKNLISDLL